VFQPVVSHCRKAKRVGTVRGDATRKELGLSFRRNIEYGFANDIALE
jgi:hypothetical protein